MYNAIDRLRRDRALPDGQMRALLLCEDRDVLSYLFQQARRVREEAYGRAVFIRGLVEFTNHCKNDCYYCGIRRSNAQAQRYRLQEEQILQCAQSGYRLGFRTIVLQGGEDPFFTDEKMVSIIRGIKSQHPDCAVTLSIGERPEKSYRAFFDAGADRYLLRHETADEAHYGLLHPAGMSFRHRMDCLKALKGDWLSDRLRVHGGLPLSNGGQPAKRPCLYCGLPAPDGGDRPVHPPPGHPL